MLTRWKNGVKISNSSAKNDKKQHRKI